MTYKVAWTVTLTSVERLTCSVLEGVEVTLKEPVLALRGPLLALSEPVLVLLESASMLDTVFWSHEAIALVLSKTLVVWAVDVRR